MFICLRVGLNNWIVCICLCVYIKEIQVENFFASNEKKEKYVQYNHQMHFANCGKFNKLTRVFYRLVRAEFAWTHVHVVLEKNLNWIQFDFFCTFCAFVANAKKPNSPTFLSWLLLAVSMLLFYCCCCFCYCLIDSLFIAMNK